MKNLVLILVIFMTFGVSFMTLNSLAMISDLNAITRHRVSVSSMIHGLMLYDYVNGCRGMKLKEIAAAIGISVVSCSRAHNGVQSLSAIPFVRLQELYKKRFNHEYNAE